VLIAPLVDQVTPTLPVTQFDLTMIVVCGSKERTLLAQRSLLAGAELPLLAATLATRPLFPTETVATERRVRLTTPLFTRHNIDVPRGAYGLARQRAGTGAQARAAAKTALNRGAASVVRRQLHGAGIGAGRQPAGFISGS